MIGLLPNRLISVAESPSQLNLQCCSRWPLAAQKNTRNLSHLSGEGDTDKAPSNEVVRCSRTRGQMALPTRHN